MPTLDLTDLQTGSPLVGVPTNKKFVKVALFPPSGTVTEYVITTEAAISAAATSASLSADASCFVEAGTVLYFAGDKITVSADTTITTSPTTVPIYAAADPIADATDADPIYGMLTFPVSSIDGFNPTVNYVDGKVNTYINQSSGLPTNINVGGTQEVTITGVLQGLASKNKAHNTVLQPSASVPIPAGFTGDVFAFIGVSSGADANGVDLYEYLFGQANVMQSGDPLPLNEARRPAYQLKFTPNSLRTTIYESESVARKAKIVTACKLAGVAVPPTTP